MPDSDCQLQYHFSSCLLRFAVSSFRTLRWLPSASVCVVCVCAGVCGAIKKCVKTVEELYNLNPAWGIRAGRNTFIDQLEE